MNLRNHSVRLAPWVAFSVPTAEQVATLEHKRNDARSWMRHGKRELTEFRKLLADKRLSCLLRPQAD